MAYVYNTDFSSGCAERTRRNSLLNIFKIATQTRRERCELASMDDHLLIDLGITRAQAVKEANRKLWDIPTQCR